MSKILSGLVVCAAAVLTGGFSGGAAAQSTWSFDGSGTTGACNVGNNTGATGAVGGGVATSSCNAGNLTTGVNVIASAWSNTGAAIGGSGNAFAQAQLADFGKNGFGAYSGNLEGTTGTTTSTDNQHAFDSITSGCGPKDIANVNTNTTNGGCGGSQELMLLNFGAKVSLTKVGIGFCGSGPECDISILRWDGGAGGPTMANLTTSTLAGSGWTLVASQAMGDTGTLANYGGQTGNEILSNVSLGNQVSSWWMISTYYGGPSGSLDAGNDRFKVLQVTANVCTGNTGVNGGNYNGGNCSSTIQVPEPGSLALAGLALLGVFAARRKPVTLSKLAF